MKRVSKRLTELDSLKGILCIIITFFCHYNWLMTTDYPIKTAFTDCLYNKGYYAVETFFILSGFGMALGYSRHLGTDKDINIISFIWKRMHKIFPIMAVALVITTILQFIHFRMYKSWYYVAEVNLYTFVLSLFNLSSGWFVLDVNLNMPLWYLSALMLDYVLYYVICRVSKNRKNVYLFLILATTLWGMSIVISGHKSDLPFTYYNVARGHACFFAGTILKEVFEFIDDEEICKRIANVFVSFLLIIICLLYFYGETRVLAGTEWLSQMMWGLILSPMLVWICLYWNPIKKLLNLKGLVKFGAEISMSMYIWHFPCYQVIRILSGGGSISQFYAKIWFYMIVISFITIVSCFSCWVIEPKINKTIENIMNTVQRQCNS